MTKKKPVLTIPFAALAVVGVLLTMACLLVHQDSAQLEHKSSLAQPFFDTSRRPPINTSAEVSVLAGAELVAQSPALEFAITTIMRSALTDAALALAIHSLGIPVIVVTSKWLAQYGHAGWTMRHRFSGIVRYLKGVKTTRRGLTIWARKVSVQSQTNTKSAVRLWHSTKKAIRHLYTKRARYSVASELTNLIPPEPKEE